MDFRPCIDIHNGKVKQLVGGSVADTSDQAQENFVSEKPAAWYASLFEEKGLKNGHVIVLNSKSSPYYEASRRQALEALSAYPGGLQVGGLNVQSGGDPADLVGVGGGHADPAPFRKGGLTRQLLFFGPIDF